MEIKFIEFAELSAKLDKIEKLLLEATKQNNETQDQLLTIKKAGEFLNLSVPTIYGLVSNKKIPHAKQGKRLYFSKQELLDWVKSGKKKTNAEVLAEVDNLLANKKRG